MAEIRRSDRTDRAVALFNSGYNCAQATLCAFADRIGIDEKTLRRVASDFGGGMSGTRETCGAVTGMLMALGLIKGYDDVTDTEAKHRLYDEGRGLIDDFTAEFGTVTCAELSSAVAAKFKTHPHPLVACCGSCRACSAFVAYAAGLLESHLE
ncbi:MAG: C-GCAxxG-C-C family protein [Clostridiales bacterium]|nr:C-GCAxxG-C-C family protein [Clostridiales bacterium]